MSPAFRTYLDQNSNPLLLVICAYLRRELRVPKYSEMYDDMLGFNKETEDLFRELPDLEAKLDKLKKITVKVSNLCVENEIKISFGVFEAFKELS
jgi:hypothetical protein